MGIPQIAIIVLYSLSLGASLILDGKPRDGKYSFWTTLVTDIIIMVLLAKGGFFKL